MYTISHALLSKCVLDALVFRVSLCVKYHAFVGKVIALKPSPWRAVCNVPIDEGHGSCRSSFLVMFSVNLRTDNTEICMCTEKGSDIRTHAHT